MERGMGRVAAEKERIKATIAGAKASRAMARAVTTGKPSRSVKRHALVKRVIIVIISINAFFIALPPFLVPVEGRVSSPFFFRFAPDTALPVLEFHDAIDIAVPPDALFVWHRIRSGLIGF